jgi:esterase
MKLFFRKYGDGPPLIILHGLYGSSDNWMTVARKISSKFTVYLPDMRNHGNSPHGDAHDFRSMTGDLLELAEDNRLDKFFLAGHSMGGKTAICFTMKWPEKINGLLVADISPFTDNDSASFAFAYHDNILRAILETDIVKAGSRKEIEIMLSERISSARDRGLIMKNIHRSADDKFSWKINAPSILDNLKEMIEGFSRPEDNEQGITGFPVIFLRGEKSVYLDPRDFRDIQKLFPAAEFRLVKNAGHWLHADNPEAVAEALVSLLDR